MFNDRDLAVIGTGAAASVCCLLLPFSFAGKLGAGAATLVLFIILAFLRLGRDRLTVEEWALRRLRFWLQPRFLTFQSRRLDPNPRVPPDPHARKEDDPEPDRPAPGEEAPQPSAALVFQLDALSVERLASLLMIVAGIYFLSWLTTGGAGALGVDLGAMLP